MTVHETELTFLRCPGCRSLVPPSATRCRMCGESLTPQQKEEASGSDAVDALGKKSRVRQRTMSLPPEQVEDVKEQLSPAPKEEVEPLKSEQSKPLERMTFTPPPPPPSRAEPERSAAKPASGGLRFGGAPAAPPPSRSAAKDTTVNDHKNIADRITKDLESDLLGEPPARTQSSSVQDNGQKLGFRVQNQIPVEESEDFDDSEDDAEDDGEEDELSVASDPSQQAPRKKRRRRRKRKKGVEGAVVSPATESSEGRPAVMRTERTEFVSSSGSAAAGSRPQSAAGLQPGATRSSPTESAPRSPGDNPPRDLREATAEARQESKSVPAIERTFPERREAPAMSSPSQQQKIEPLAQRGKAVEPRTQPARDDESALVGWLVNYGTDTKGVATEIRGGRFFVCGERLKDSDLVVTEPTISTPHCVIKAQAGEGLKVQDLLSEKGTYVRKSGEDKFYQYSESVNVEHGDWLRFGDYEVLVCLVSFAKKR